MIDAQVAGLAALTLASETLRTLVQRDVLTVAQAIETIERAAVLHEKSGAPANVAAAALLRAHKII